MNNKYDIDVVVLWVDGNDPKWQKEKNKYIENPTAKKNDVVRYRDWDIMQYWFRSIEKYMPWVRKIHFVTWGHIPSWLDEKNPKLNIVNHKDFIPEKYLPTFNSPVIEMNIHRIKGLAEHFIYFNDDMFPLKNLKVEDFFVNGKPCDCAVMNTTSLIPGGENESYIQFNNSGIINKYFNKQQVLSENFGKWYSVKYKKQIIRNIMLKSWPYFTGFYTCHIPSSMLKSTFETIWEKEYDFLDKMCVNKFRSKNMINQWLVSEWQMCAGNFYPRSINFGRAFELTENLESNKLIFETIVKQKYNMICINDYIYDNEIFEKIKKELKESFEKNLPEKSSFEK